LIDIEFYQKFYKLKYGLMKGRKYPRDYVADELDAMRSSTPVVYNIETTNACNMTCECCPRTTMMTRPVETMKPAVFKRIIDQLHPFTPEALRKWDWFVEDYYGIPPTAMEENHFFLYIIPRVIVLHGYGDPLLDPNMPQYVKWMTERGLESYFSCNPANINMKRMVETFANGLGYIKFSFESTDDRRFKMVRGESANFTESYAQVMELLNLKFKRGYKTTIVITMLDLNKPDQQEEYAKLVDKFKGTDVYIYLKSQDQVWYEDNNAVTNSIHWKEPCQFPWSSMTIKSDGKAAMCVEDYNNEIILGDARHNSLAEIWNGEKYAELRRNHLNVTPGIKCSERCDMKLMGEYL
jgi:wyosine [tRNA(Phe)-imidazoG37] synthetase (radical SAM superfamily)